MILLIAHNHISSFLHHRQPRRPIRYLLLQPLHISFVLYIFRIFYAWLCKVDLLKHLDIITYLSLLFSFSHLYIQTGFLLVQDGEVLERGSVLLGFGFWQLLVDWVHALLGGVELNVADVDELVHAVLVEELAADQLLAA